MSVATSCPAAAQACACNLCTAPGSVSLSNTILDIGDKTVRQIGEVTGIITSNYTLATQAFSEQATSGFAQIVTDLIDWIDTFWYYNELPARQAMTEQANVMGMHNTSAVSRFRDAEELARTAHLQDELAAQAERETRPGHHVCVAGAVAGGMARSNAFRKAYERAAPAERGRRSGAAKGSTGENGTAADISARHQAFLARYCDPRDNAGGACGASSGAFVNADIDVAGTVFNRTTIDVLDDDLRRAKDDLIINIAEPFVENPIAASQVNSASGIDAMTQRDIRRAQRQVIHLALEHSVARRIPGSKMGEFVSVLREQAGLPPDRISSNPSYHEIMQAMMVDRFRTGAYGIEQLDTPDNNLRELTIQNAFQVMQMDDHLELMDRFALVIAAQTGIEVQRHRMPDPSRLKRGGGQ